MRSEKATLFILAFFNLKYFGKFCFRFLLLNESLKPEDMKMIEDSYKAPNCKTRNFIYFLHLMLRMGMETSTAGVFEAWIKENADKIRSFVLFGDSFLHQAIFCHVHFQGLMIDGRLYYHTNGSLKLLLEVCDVNARNKCNKTPLHYISELVYDSFQGWWNHYDLQLANLNMAAYDLHVANWSMVADILINHGAHLDILSDKGVPAVYGLSKKWRKTYNKVPSIKCLATRVIVKHGVEYNKLPQLLQEYVKLHEGQEKSYLEIRADREGERKLEQEMYRDQFDKYRSWLERRNLQAIL